MTIDFQGRTVVVTGAGSGLGRSHAIGFARLGANVVVNDIGPERGSAAGQSVVAEIEALGAEAFTDGADVSDFAQVSAMVERAEARWGGVDILVNNAGILLDRSFGKMTMDEFRRVIDVHLIGSANCAKAVWAGMRERSYGRIIFTTSASGIYGNFGQANYGAAKAGLVGLMNVLHIEGAKYGIRVNALAPSAATAMTQGLFPEQSIERLQPEAVTPGVLFLASEQAPSRVILCAGGGVFARATIAETEGIFLPPNALTADAVAQHFDAIVDVAGQRDVRDAYDQSLAYSDRVSRFTEATA
ncbi:MULTISPECIES: SDR family NAD(P)-dependent oxidoreductase [unclassified Sphingomonas]|uniref:SDR family NAD(P)-dependent oxidoreductase n=1 Tax=unclassified Sphingomonas TaxID=196159 RepID=UPI0006FBA0DF|nr:MULTISPECIES: SDR family NAD(P)-dependent oxidoreductase [unclassified Sphingomonas]KQX23491.1 3-oxoacyl-ACP reductase [Sphingomonas sp. Root1294]KQY68341.1 3-oxoacyl-ACP reductase [Sphingomonas sp. Root50]KRB91243.1 3-oxoacyl-ACP reductase [Sphingomonas sp. Root720]